MHRRDEVQPRICNHSKVPIPRGRAQRWQCEYARKHTATHACTHALVSFPDSQSNTAKQDDFLDVSAVSRSLPMLDLWICQDSLGCVDDLEVPFRRA